jgi:hypothetical protein
VEHNLIKPQVQTHEFTAAFGDFNTPGSETEENQYDLSCIQQLPQSSGHHLHL